jgi:MSHA biogenesis protein MshP
MKLMHMEQRGFAAVAAIFLVVLLAALGSFMISFSNTQHINSAQDAQGSRAYWAARAGLEWAIVAIPANPALCPNVALTQVAVASAPSPIEGHSIKIFCSKSTYSDQNAANGSSTVTMYKFESQASFGVAGGASFIERSVAAALEQ